jgi:hypothetical protein
LASLAQCGGELRAAVEGVGPLPCLHFHELPDDRVALGLGDERNGGTPSLDTEIGATLLRRADPDVPHQDPFAHARLLMQSAAWGCVASTRQKM